MKVFKGAVLASVMALGIVQASADQTNLVQNLNVRLNGVKQGRTFTSRDIVTVNVDFVSINNRRVIEALGVATANSFSSTGKLVVVTGLTGGDSSIQVRDGAVKVDVTRFFTFQQTSDTVHSGTQNTRTGRFFSTDYSIQRVTLHDAEGAAAPLPLHFDVSGVATEDSGNGPGGPHGELDVNGSGTGDRNGDQLILDGSIGVQGRTLEVVPGGGDGGPNV